MSFATIFLRLAGAQPRPAFVVSAPNHVKGLLERVVGRVTPEHPPELSQNDVLLLLVEPFERWNAHRLHHPYKRGRPSTCEMWATGVAEWVSVV